MRRMKGTNSPPVATMTRDKTKTEEEGSQMERIARLQTLAEVVLPGNLISRGQLRARLGMSHSDERNLYEALGYPTELQYSHFAAQYERQDIARAVINRPVEATWRGDFSVLESDDDEETELEAAWLGLAERLALKSRFVRLDKLVGIGHYGILLLGLDDAKSSKDFAKPVKPGGANGRKLLYVKPLGEGAATIKDWEKNTASERYGLPLTYDVSIKSPGQDATSQVVIHHTRVIHVAGELLESETTGTPRLKPVYNRLKDIEKLTGGSAEMFWRGARPGYKGKIDPEFTLTDDFTDTLQAQIDEYEHNLRRILINEGFDLEALSTQVSDPSSHIDIQIQMISAVTGIPKRILTGSERGELASTQDKASWLSLIQFRREEFAEPLVVRPFVDKCIELKILPEPEESYSIKWEDLYALSDLEKAEVGKSRAAALKDYTASPTAEMVLPPEAFLEFFLGLSPEQIELIEEMRERMIREEEELAAAVALEEEEELAKMLEIEEEPEE